MTEEKARFFVEKLIATTKEKKIFWQRATMHRAEYDMAKSFEASANGMVVYLMYAQTYDPPYCIVLLIQYDKNLPVARIEYEECNEFQELLIRLHTLVTSIFPSAEKAIDDFLNNF